MKPENEILLRSLADLEPIKEKIGKGSFAQVKLVKHKETGALLALKEIDLNNSLNYREESKLIEREIKIHKDLCHQNIIRLYDSLQIKKKYYLLLEFAHHGDLYKLLLKKKRIHEKDVRFGLFYKKICLDGSFIENVAYIYPKCCPNKYSSNIISKFNKFFCYFFLKFCKIFIKNSK